MVLTISMTILVTILMGVETRLHSVGRRLSFLYRGSAGVLLLASAGVTSVKELGRHVGEFLRR